jgi:hypothetical protein
MLEPGTRTLLLDALRPPEGYRLANAVGTTFSLDLHALLLPPLAFALFDWAADEDAGANPIALLEAVRRNAERMTLFCQAGQIGVPKNYRSLLVYLESCVVESTPPDRERIFHPKVWVLKFVSDHDEPAYRLLCLSRNLTFDRAWDTVLVLDGVEATSDRRAVRRRNRPLQDFLRALPDLATRPVSGEVRGRVEQLAEEISDVEFVLPQGFSDLAFHPLGFNRRTPKLREDGDRMLVVSPFLTKGALTRLSSAGNRHVLVSRQESIDAVGADACAGFDDIFVLAPHAWAEFAAEEQTMATTANVTASPNEAVGESPDEELTGLHAKLFVAQRPNQVRVFTGSANATDAAFTGNVEFLVELSTNAWQVHIDRLLEPGGEEGSLRDLLQPYTPATEEAPAETDQQQVQRALDQARRQLGSCGFTATLNEAGDGFELHLHAGTDGALALEGVERVLCWPVSLGAGSAVVPRISKTDLDAAFGKVSAESVTAFFAFELTGRCGHAVDTVRLVVNAHVEGGPADRRERVLIDMLRSRSDVLRYLLFLLAEGGVEAQGLADALMGEPSGGSHGDHQVAQWQVPLFESLLRTLATDPSRLDHLAKVIADLQRTGRGEELLPDGLEAVWAPIWQTRKGLLP